MDPTSVSREELEQAFALFNQASSQLAGAYHELQQKVEHLTQELAIANGELRRQYLEKEALSQRLSLLLAALPAGVVVVDADDCIREANAAAQAMFAGSPVERRWEALAGERLRPTATPGQWELAGDGEVPRRVSIGESFLAAGGKIMLIHDITEAYRMQQALQRHQRLTAMGEMTAGLAHQLRTPLATALLYAANLGRTGLSDADRARFADKVLARLKHLERLIQDMLLFVKGEHGAPEAISVSSLLGELHQVMEPQMALRKLDFVVRDAAGGAVVYGARKALAGALLNLLENALQACGEGDQIRLEAAGDTAAVTFAVADTGAGIDPAVQEKLFEPFFTTRTEGTGLGLAIVRGVAEAHGGDVSVVSRPGAGSEFRLRLPLLEPPSWNKE